MQDGGGPLHSAFMQGARGHRQPVARGLQQLVIEDGELIEDLFARTDRQFGCGRGRGGAEIGDEVGNGEVRLVPNSRDNGTVLAAMARATDSSLKVHRSSSDPPPRATITTCAHPELLKYSMPRQTASTDPSPCTSAG